MKQAVVSGLVAGGVVAVVILALALDWTSLAAWTTAAAPSVGGGALRVVQLLVVLLLAVFGAIGMGVGLNEFCMAWIEEDDWSYKFREAGKGLALAVGSVLVMLIVALLFKRVGLL